MTTAGASATPPEPIVLGVAAIAMPRGVAALPRNVPVADASLPVGAPA